jgi:hypothetical protein
VGPPKSAVLYSTYRLSLKRFGSDEDAEVYCTFHRSGAILAGLYRKRQYSGVC